MEEFPLEIVPLLWAFGWVLAVAALFWAALKLPLETRFGRWQSWLYSSGVVLVGIGVCVLANIALVLHDEHVDVTREKIYTPSAAALRVVDELDREVAVTYFYRSQDPTARRARDILEVMEKRNPLFKLTL